MPDPPDLLPAWLDLCSNAGVRGRQTYDARIAALMLKSSISKLVTLNPTDFTRYQSIELLVPGQNG